VVHSRLTMALCRRAGIAPAPQRTEGRQPRQTEVCSPAAAAAAAATVLVTCTHEIVLPRWNRPHHRAARAYDELCGGHWAGAFLGDRCVSWTKPEKEPTPQGSIPFVFLKTNDVQIARFPTVLHTGPVQCRRHDSHLLRQEATNSLKCPKKMNRKRAHSRHAYMCCRQSMMKKCRYPLLPVTSPPSSATIAVVFQYWSYLHNVT